VWIGVLTTTGFKIIRESIEIVRHDLRIPYENQELAFHVKLFALSQAKTLVLCQMKTTADKSFCEFFVQLTGSRP
jgi:hypothetical protein